MARPRAGQAMVAVRLGDIRYADVFTVVAEDVVRHLSQAADSATAVGSLITRLRKWQQFLERHPPEGLSPFACQGLYGELRLLQRLLASRVGPREAVEAWVGPQAANQDFQFPAVAIEAKTSTAKMHQMLEIASERQLDGSGVRHLFLFFLSLDERRGGGEALPALVADLRCQLASDPLTAESFESRLLEGGYLDVHAQRYMESGYTVRDAHFFRVEGDFPRIVESDLRPGVGSVRYTISAAECMHFVVDEDNVIAAISGGGT
jgi:hypothetical protein